MNRAPIPRHPFATSSERAAARWHATNETERAAIQRQCGPLPTFNALPFTRGEFGGLPAMMLDQFKTPRA